MVSVPGLAKVAQHNMVLDIDRTGGGVGEGTEEVEGIYRGILMGGGVF